MDTTGRRTLAVAGVVVAAAVPGVQAAQPSPETLAGWDAYIQATESRIEQELRSAPGFLEANREDNERDVASLTNGRMPIVRVAATTSQGRAMAVYEGMVHHWRGRVLVPGATLDALLARLLEPRPEDLVQEDVLEGRVLDRSPDAVRLFLRLRRSQIVTVVYDTEHSVRYQRHGPGRASSRSVATRIVEVSEPGTPDERERPPDDDRGFLWRLHAYWRYLQTDEGVIVECESISLSRSVPSLVAAAIRPIIDGVARGSMERTLAALRRRYAGEPARTALHARIP